MKWMVGSDIHGSEFFAEKLVKAYKKEGLLSYYYWVIFFIMVLVMIYL